MATDTTTDERRGASLLPEPPSDEAIGYAKLNAAYGVLLVSVLAATRERARAQPLRGAELVPLGAATFALSKVIAKEKVGTWVREPFVEEQRSGRPPRGEGLQRAIGELLTCSRCVGAWTALGLVGLRLAQPRTGRTVTTVFAAAGLNDFMQAGFRGLCGWADSRRS